MLALIRPYLSIDIQTKMHTNKSTFILSLYFRSFIKLFTTIQNNATVCRCLSLSLLDISIYRYIVTRQTATNTDPDLIPAPSIPHTWLPLMILTISILK